MRASNPQRRSRTQPVRLASLTANHFQTCSDRVSPGVRLRRAGTSMAKKAAIQALPAAQELQRALNSLHQIKTLRESAEEELTAKKEKLAQTRVESKEKSQQKVEAKKEKKDAEKKEGETKEGEKKDTAKPADGKTETPKKE